MRNPFRSVMNVVVAAVATIALAPVVLTPTAAFARGGGGGGGRGGSGGGNPVPTGGGGAGPGGPGGNSGGKGSTSGGKGGGKGKGAASGQSVKPSEYLIQIQQDDADDHRADFLVDALDDATVDARDKDRALALAASRESQSKKLRADDLTRP